MPQDSAILPGHISIGIHGNHMDMTKFANVDDPGFVAVCGELGRWIRMAVVVTPPRALPDRSRGGPQGANEREPQAKVGKVFRVRGVPRDWDAEQLQSFLQKEEFQPQDGSAGPIVRSLADEVGGRSRVGTVTFRSVPPALQTGGQWTIPLPPFSAAGQPARPSRQLRLTLDEEFHGITTLYSPPSEDHKLE